MEFNKFDEFKFIRATRITHHTEPGIIDSKSLSPGDVFIVVFITARKFWMTVVRKEDYDAYVLSELSRVSYHGEICLSVDWFADQIRNGNIIKLYDRP
jgi:hypothetical protein